MTKQEYLHALRYELSPLSVEEREEALLYYENYFEDAGKENEQATIAALGDVKELAKHIIEDTICVPSSQRSTHSTGSNATKTAKNSKKGVVFNKYLLIALVVITFPIWIHLVGLLFGLFVSVLAIGFAGVVVAFAFIAVAIAGIGVAGTLFVVSPFTALFGFGIGFFAIGFALLAFMLGIWFFKTAVPFIFIKIKAGLSYASRKFKNS